MRKIRSIIIMMLFISLITTVILAVDRHDREEKFVRGVHNISEGQLLTVVSKVCDPDGDIISIEFEDVPEGVEFSDIYEIPLSEAPVSDPNCAECAADPNSTWYGVNWSWTPTYEQDGQYEIYLHATDGQGGGDWVVHIINVADTNRPPVL